MSSACALEERLRCMSISHHGLASGDLSLPCAHRAPGMSCAYESVLVPSLAEPLLSQYQSYASQTCLSMPQAAEEYYHVSPPFSRASTSSPSRFNLSVQIPEMMTDATAIEGESILRLSPPNQLMAWPIAPTAGSMIHPQFVNAHMACPWQQS
ncbi:hypothetical protein CEUSTIGMA_g530.t1 [Chlamydomonas eustigma]|uniref:Uncharacterized protein n=1 Tax=Chlamydomonas eustigma TaxID=1157962 RepID=A0A250WQG1_9CHLO|nr:hypothetical protein CEUSTIGMA_g530.t1 [Chlamydomonas eustigma]|eukprot:GAX73077.1 hypothetical protein CEUSTIGMA_g530.t1 [Chlamydomonas eustigma]